jgi:small subunit ribosomal protein S4
LPGATGENLLILLERRLDNVIYQLGFASSRTQARQIVKHGHILINGKKVDIPSYLVKPNQVITLSEKMRKNPFVKRALEERDPEKITGWLKLDRENMTGTVLRLPKREDITIPLQENLIVELYSK